MRHEVKCHTECAVSAGAVGVTFNPPALLDGCLSASSGGLNHLIVGGK